MPTMKKLSLVLSALVLAVLLALPAAAQATLAYVRNPLHPTVYAAGDDGSGAKRLVAGENPHVSPDGKIVALLRQGLVGKSKPPRTFPEMVLAPADGSAPPTVLARGWRLPEVFAWSPDGKLVVAVLGPELGKQRLVLIDTETGAQRTLAHGFFNGVSFSPSGDELVYGMAGMEKFPPRSDLYRIEVLPPGAVSVKAVVPQRLTKDHRSSYPLWGAQKIVFVKTVDAKKRKYGPKNELYLANPSGKGVKRLTHTKVDPLLQGLFPTDWSLSGNQLLAEFEGQDTSYAVKVNPKTGAEKPVAQVGEQGFVGTALSNDGKFVLGYTGGFDPGLNHDVISVPYAGGKGKVLAKNAFEPDWSR
jgi:dipeptidyl aminopeptidase/acylaminoacyl peptidase